MEDTAKAFERLGDMLSAAKWWTDLTNQQREQYRFEMAAKTGHQVNPNNFNKVWASLTGEQRTNLLLELYMEKN